MTILNYRFMVLFFFLLTPSLGFSYLNGCVSCMWPKVEVYMAEKVKNQDGDFSDLAQSPVFDQSSYTCVNRPKTVKGKKIIPCGGFAFTSFSNCLINLSKLRERFFSFGEKQTTEKLCSIAYYTGENLKKDVCGHFEPLHTKEACQGLEKADDFTKVLDAFLYSGVSRWYLENKKYVVKQRENSKHKKSKKKK